MNEKVCKIQSSSYRIGQERISIALKKLKYNLKSSNKATKKALAKMISLINYYKSYINSFRICKMREYFPIDILGST